MLPDQRVTLLCRQILDGDGNMQLSFEELREGLLRLRVVPAIALTEEDFDHLTDVRPLTMRHHRI
jgi:hypothetical protein